MGIDATLIVTAASLRHRHRLRGCDAFFYIPGMTLATIPTVTVVITKGVAELRLMK
jgi:hypothetical protein